MGHLGLGVRRLNFFDYICPEPRTSADEVVRNTWAIAQGEGGAAGRLTDCVGWVLSAHFSNFVIQVDSTCPDAWPCRLRCHGYGGYLAVTVTHLVDFPCHDLKSVLPSLLLGD